jgi:glucose dehydrogenase
MDGIKLGPIFNPAVHRGNEDGYRAAAVCPGILGGNNIIGGTVADPETGILYVASVKSCTALALAPAAERDDGSPGRNTGVTVVDWIQAPVAFPSVERLPVLKPPYGRITGEHLWWIPNGDTPERVAEHPLLAGIDIGNTGQPSHATALVTRSLLIYGEGRTGEARLHAVDKRTGERIATIALPARSSTAPMTYLHDGRQYIIVPVGGGGHAGSLAALALPHRE